MAMNGPSLFSDVGEQYSLVVPECGYPLSRTQLGFEPQSPLPTCRHCAFEFNASFFEGVPSSELLISKNVVADVP